MDKKQLNYYYEMVTETILKYQNPATGLIATSYSSPDCWIRDNTYGLLSVWGLSLAYKKLPDVDEDRFRSAQLEKNVVKSMRGMLSCIMRQSKKVERFKATQNPLDSVHAKFDSRTGRQTVGDGEWGHLQIDAISLFLLTLAQMTSCGLRIVWTYEEVAMVQNLVFYIEMAYRIPDYGTWERGDKTNHGLPELNTSSVGMAKAALEAMSELDLFGEGDPFSTVHVMPDETQQCQAVLQTMLPRESLSKETDSALLPIIGFPAFAVDDTKLIEVTNKTLTRTLEGSYGFKRFLRDGFRTVNEDPNRLHYNSFELKRFEGLECEWPVLFGFVILSAAFRNDKETAAKYLRKLEKHLIPRKSSSGAKDNNFLCVAESFTIPHSNAEKEKANPGSQPRIAVGKLPYLWGQSLYVLCKLISEDFLLPGELDPLGRRMVTEPKPDLVVQIVVIAEDTKIQERLAKYGFQVETFEEIRSTANVLVFPAKILSCFYKQLGVCKSLGLSGRMNREVGILATSKLYTIGGHTLAFTPQLLDMNVFYMCTDVCFTIDCFQTDVAFIRTTWNELGRPTMILPIYKRFEVSRDSQTLQPALVSTLKKLQSGYINGTRVKLGKMAHFISTSCIARLDFIPSDNDILSKAKMQCASVGTSHRLANAYRTPTNPYQRRMSAALACAVMSDLENDSTGRTRSPSIASPTSEETRFAFDDDMQDQNRDDVSGVSLPMPSQEKRAWIDDMITPIVYVFKFSTHHLRSPNDLGMESESSNGISSTRRIRCTTGELDDVLSNNTLEENVERLADSDNLFQQAEIIFYLSAVKGIEWDTRMGGSRCTVRDLLKEVYERAGQSKIWWLVRDTAGQLKKRVEHIAKAVTDLLVRQKQVTVGLPPEPREKIITSPMSPDKLAELIQQACEADLSMAMLTQEILVYLAMFARTEPQLLMQMNRIRVGLIIQVMASEIARTLSCSAEEASCHLVSLSPYETKTLLHNILNGKEFQIEMNTDEQGVEHYTITSDADRTTVGSAPSEFGELCRHGQWLRRRKIDGALNRVPPGFYKRLYQLLLRCSSLCIQNMTLDVALTYEMTSGETKFALAVERIMNTIHTPEYRQLLVEALVMLGMLNEVDKKNAINLAGQNISVDNLVLKAHEYFLKDQSEHAGDATLCCAPSGANLEVNCLPSHSEFSNTEWAPGGALVCRKTHGLCVHFYDTAPSGRYGTITYLVRALTTVIPIPTNERGNLPTECLQQ